MSEHPPCPICGGEVVRWNRESHSHWAERATCSRDCAYSYRTSAQRAVTPCPGCGKRKSYSQMVCEDCLRAAKAAQLAADIFKGLGDCFANNVPDDIDRYGRGPGLPSVNRTMGGVAVVW